MPTLEDMGLPSYTGMAKQLDILSKENELLRRILAVARMANRKNKDIRVTLALKNWDDRKLNTAPTRKD